MNLHGDADMRDTCKHCGAKIIFSANEKKWVTTRHTKRGGIKTDWHCGNDATFPVRAHSPEQEADRLSA